MLTVNKCYILIHILYYIIIQKPYNILLYIKRMYILVHQSVKKVSPFDFITMTQHRIIKVIKNPPVPKFNQR